MSQEELELAAFGRRTAFTDGPGSLTIAECRWLRCRAFFDEAGYMFRAPRYQEGWVPSWKGKNQFYQETEDGQVRVRLLVSIYILFVSSQDPYRPISCSTPSGLQMERLS